MPVSLHRVTSMVSSGDYSDHCRIICIKTACDCVSSIMSRIRSPQEAHHHHYHLSLHREVRWGSTDDFTISSLHFPLFSTALWYLPNSRPVHSLMLSSHLFLSPPCLLLPFTVPCKVILARPDKRETWPYYCSLSLFTIVRSSYGPIACWILARTSSLVTWSLYEMHSILR